MQHRDPRHRRSLPRIPLLVLAAVVLLAGCASTTGGSDADSVVAAASGAAPSITPQSRLGDADLAARLDSELARFRNDARVPGVVAAMRLPDGSVWTGAAGRREAGPDTPRATVDTPWAIGSITKSFVAALALQLQEEGKLSLDDPITTWLPDYPNGDAITLRMLLNHTSGIFNYFFHPDYESLVFGRPTHVWTVDEILALAADRRPSFAPGTSYEYSNTNYILAGEILRQVGGESLSSQLRTRFFDPLGLTSTVFQGEEEIPAGAAKGYLREDHAWIDVSDGTNFRPNTSAATVVWAAGAILSTATDLLRWEQALYGGAVLTPESMAQMLDFGRDGYGLATRYQPLAGGDGLGHGGSLRGFVAVMYRLPDPGVDVVVLTNRGGVYLNDIADSLTRIALGLPPATSPRP